MRNVINYISYVPKSFMVAVTIFSLVAAPFAGSYASWSPERETFTIDEPADYVTFNSITDNPNYGDERTFFDAKPASHDEEGGFSDKIEVSDLEDGEKVTLRMYVHNNAKEELNGEDFEGEGVAENTRVRAMLPEATDRALRPIGYISADNADPGEVSDTVDLHSDGRPFNLDFVEDSAKIHTNAKPDGMQLDNSIVEDEGAQIGYDKLDGRVPGCFEYTGIVTLDVEVNKSDVEVDKSVREAGDDGWHNEINAEPGDELEYLIEMKNIGDTTLEDVAVGDNLPKYQSYVEGSTRYANASTGGEFQDLGSDNITRGGEDIGDYAPGANAFVMFEAQLDEHNQFETCGDYTLRNVGIIRPFHNDETMNQFLSTADVNVSVECESEPEEEEEEDFVKCVDLDASATHGEGELEVDFDADFDAKNRNVEGFKIDYGDGSSEQVTGTSASHVYTDTGEYEARVTHVVTAEGTETVETNACAVHITVEEEPEPEPEPEQPGKEEQPEELANTGIGGPLAALLASGSLGAGFRGWLMSRRNLRRQLVS